MLPSSLGMSKKIALMIILLCLFVSDTVQQKGGSRSSPDRDFYQQSSRHHPRGSGFRGGGYNNPIGANQNCTTVNGTTTCVSTTTDGGSSWYVFIIVLGIFGVIGYFSVKEGIRQDERRKEIIAKAMSEFDGRMEAFPSVYDLQVRQSMIDAFMTRKYTMVINVKDQSQKFYCQLTVKDLNKVNDNKYEIKLLGNDEVGTSKLSGLLVFREDGLAIKLSKVYDDRQKAEQVGKFDVLLYEGIGNPDQMKGQWAFNGFYNSLEYSGYWYMAQL